MTPRRAAVAGALSSYLLVGGWVCWHSTSSPRAPEEDSVGYALNLIPTFVTIGAAVALTAAVVAWWIARHA